MRDVFSAICFQIEGILPDSPPALIVAGRLSDLPELRQYVVGHVYCDRERNHLTIDDIMNPSHHFSTNQHPGRYIFVAPEIVGTLDVTTCQIFCYEPSLIPSLCLLRPTLFVFFLLRAQFARLRFTVPVQFRSAFNFEQYACFPSRYSRDDFCILSQSSRALGPFPFPDMREFHPEIADRIRVWAECGPCVHCGAILLQGMPHGFCCAPFGDRILANLPDPMDEELLSRIVQLSQSNPNFSRILNQYLRPVFQYASISSPNAAASNLFITGIPYALDFYRQFTTPVYAIFSRNDQTVPPAVADMEQLIALILTRNETLRDYLRPRLEAVREIAIISMDEPDEGMNLAIFNAEGALLNDHQIEALRISYQTHKLCQFHMLYDQLVYPLIFWTGFGGCGVSEDEGPQGASTRIRKALISLILQPRDHFIHQLTTLREEFVCAVSGRLVNLRIRFLAKAQRSYFAREDEIRGQTAEGMPKEYGMRTFIPPSLTDSDEYWRHVATKCFAISTQFGAPTFFLIFTMNPYWIDYQSLKRDNGTFAD
jgi:hypothetical protein